MTRCCTIQHDRRGSVSLFMIIILVLGALVVTMMTMTRARDHDLTVRRVETEQAFYAAEGVMNMAMRELMENSDEDGDGVVGSISDDGLVVNDPNIGGASGSVSATPGGTTLLASHAVHGRSVRAVDANVVATPGNYQVFDGTGIGTTYPTFADLEAAYQAFIGVTTDEITFDGVPLNTVISNHFAAQGVTFSNTGGSLAGIREEDDQNVEPLDGYDGTYRANHDHLYVRWRNDNPASPFTFEFDTPVARVGSFIGTGKEGAEPRLAVKIYNTADEEIADLTVWTDDFFEFHNREGFWGVIFDEPVIKRVTVRSISSVNYANAVIIDTIQWSDTPGPGGADVHVVSAWSEVAPE